MGACLLNDDRCLVFGFWQQRNQERAFEEMEKQREVSYYLCAYSHHVDEAMKALAGQRKQCTT
jgi:hypothetical protein